jgi:hypothetical protein
MYKLKPITKEAIPRALEKAERYRLLNEPLEAESICMDILQIDPANQKALVTLLLARTDQFDEEVTMHQAKEILDRLKGDYEKAYYNGIIHERWAKAVLKRGRPGAGTLAFEWFEIAMEHYEKAYAVRPPENDDAALRWNACARLLMRNPSLTPALEERVELPLE